MVEDPKARNAILRMTGMNNDGRSTLNVDPRYMDKFDSGSGDRNTNNGEHKEGLGLSSKRKHENGPYGKVKKHCGGKNLPHQRYNLPQGESMAQTLGLGDISSHNVQENNSAPEWFLDYSRSMKESLNAIETKILELDARNQGVSPTEKDMVPSSEYPFFDLSVPSEDLWEGQLEGDMMTVVDNLGFCLAVNIVTEKIELLDFVFDVSGMLGRPRSQVAELVLDRITCPMDWPPLFKARHKFQGHMTFAPFDESLRRQYLFPWDLPVIEDWPDFPESEDEEEGERTQQTTQAKGEHRPNNSAVDEGLQMGASRVPRTIQKKASGLLSLLQAAAANKDAGEASLVLDPLAQAIAPLSEPEPGFGDWPALMNFIKEKKPDLREKSDFVSAPSGSFGSKYEETFFSKSDYFKGPLDWFSLINAGKINSAGKRIDGGSALNKGKFISHGLGKVRKYYRHGDKEHLPLTIQEDVKRHIIAPRRQGFDSEPLHIQPNLARILGDSVSYARECVATSKIMTDILKEDPALQNLSSQSKAALFSLEKSLGDTNMIVASMHGNLMLAKRDQLISALPYDFFSGRPNLGPGIRSDNLDGPVISAERVKELDDIRRDITEKEGRRAAPRQNYQYQSGSTHSSLRGGFILRRGSRQQSRSVQFTPGVGRGSTQVPRSTQGTSQPFRGRAWENTSSFRAGSRGARGNSSRRASRGFSR